MTQRINLHRGGDWVNLGSNNVVFQVRSGQVLVYIGTSTDEDSDDNAYYIDDFFVYNGTENVFVKSIGEATIIQDKLVWFCFINQTKLNKGFKMTLNIHNFSNNKFLHNIYDIISKPYKFYILCLITILLGLIEYIIQKG